MPIVGNPTGDLSMETSGKFMEWKSGKLSRMNLATLAKLGEDIAENLLREDGWRIEPFPNLFYRKRKCSKIELLISRCQEHCPLEKHGLKKLCVQWPSTQVIWAECHRYLSEFCFEICDKLCRNRMAEKIHSEVHHKYGESPTLDFVAYKDRKVYAVEVKTGKHSELKVEQKEFAERLQKELGIGLLHIHIKMGDELDYSARLRHYPSKSG